MAKIKNIGWSIGNYCNAKCNHCYSWKTRKKSSDILTEDEVSVIISKLIDWGVETVNFGGNEPIFTNGKDVEQTMLPDIVRRLTRADITCGITTNGYTALYLYEHHRDVFLMVNDWDLSLDSPYRVSLLSGEPADLPDPILSYAGPGLLLECMLGTLARAVGVRYVDFG